MFGLKPRGRDTAADFINETAANRQRSNAVVFLDLRYDLRISQFVREL
jgi:hypothetical protein